MKEYSTADSRCPSSAVQDISIIWKVIILHDAIQIIEKVISGVHDLKNILTKGSALNNEKKRNLKLTVMLLEEILHSLVTPEFFNASSKFGGDALIEISRQKKWDL
jgi:hypothetical protein